MSGGLWAKSDLDFFSRSSDNECLESGVVGRPVASVDGYKYSDAMTAWGSGKAWDEATLAPYLSDPVRSGLLRGAARIAVAGHLLALRAVLLIARLRVLRRFAFVLAAVTLTAFLLWERRSTHPMLPLSFFRDRRMSVGSGAANASSAIRRTAAQPSKSLRSFL